MSHEGGTKHFANAQRRLAEMRRRGAANSAAKRQEEEWVKQMEEAALKDYRRAVITNVYALFKIRKEDR